MLKIKADSIEDAKRKLTEGLMYYHVIRKLMKQSTIDAKIYSDDKFRNEIGELSFNELDFVKWCKEYHNIKCEEVLCDLLDELRYGKNK